MCVKQNAIDYASQYPLAAAAVDLSFYVDNGADSAEDAIELQTQFHNLFLKCGFLLRNGVGMQTSACALFDIREAHFFSSRVTTPQSPSCTDKFNSHFTMSTINSNK